MIKNTITRVPLVLALAGLSLLSGCLAIAPKAAPPEQTAAVVPVPVAQPAPLPVGLTEGIALYNKGDFNGAIKRLSGASEIWTAHKTVQQEALKYMAFSYCVTARQSLCRQQFEKAVALDPSFDLEPGEKGHPLWGPIFDKVKKVK